jgi:peptidoglycan hydrolase FlgJ
MAMEPILPPGMSAIALGPASASDPARMKAAAQELEGVFIGFLMKAMRSTVSQGGLFKQGADSQSYQDMFDQEVGRTLAKSGGIGLAAMILRDQALRQTGSTADQAAGSAETVRDGEPAQNRSSFPDGVPIEPTVR